MSRSFGASSLTTSPPIFSSPAVMSSSPAIIRSAVDLPQPEGPTRIMNSPSPIVEVHLLDGLVAVREVLGHLVEDDLGHCVRSLSLDGARGQPGDDPALEQQDEDDDRDRHDHRCRGDVAGRLGELGLAGEEGERRRNGSRRVR